MTTVTTLTANASQDEYTEADYADMFAELRKGISLDKFCKRIGSAFSKAQWNNWENDNRKLTRPMRSELRRAVGLAPLPPTVAEAVAVAHPNAEVVRVGDDEVRRIVLTGCKPLTVSLNGTVAVVDSSAQETHVTPVTSPQAARRDKRHRLTVNADNVAWLREKGLTADGAIRKLRAME